MMDAKITAIKDLIDIPKDINKLINYEKKLSDLSLSLLFDSRTKILHSIDASKMVDNTDRIIFQLKLRLDSLIDHARRIDIRLNARIQDKVRNLILNNTIILDFIIFSRSWDLKIELKEVDSILFTNEFTKINTVVKQILEDLQELDNLFSTKEQIQTNLKSSEDFVAILNEQFYRELEFAEKAGALKGLIKLEKPKFIGKEKYFTQLVNIVLKIILSFGLSKESEPISLSMIYSRLKEQYPRVIAEIKDIHRVLENLNQQGLIIMEQDYNGLFWIQLYSSDKESTIILELAREKGYLTLEELVMRTKWSIEKAQKEIAKFVKANCAVIDSNYSTGIRYYFPGLVE